MFIRPSFAAFLLVGLASQAVADDFYLKDGDRVVFYGDSITEQRLYTTYVETFAVTRFPAMKFEFVHSGWGGDRVTGGGGGNLTKRLTRDVVAYDPTVITVMLGMNDASYRPFDQGIFDTYRRGYDRLVAGLKVACPEARLTLIRPSPYDDITRNPNFEGGYNAVLQRYGDYVAELAKEEGATLADLNTSVVDATKKAKEIDPTLAIELNHDRIHPGKGGQLLMAEALLKAWNAPALVSSVEIDLATNPFTLTAENTRFLQPPNLDDEGIAYWSQIDSALPFPIDMEDKTVALAVKASDVIQALDQQIVKVKGLKADSYELKIDDQPIGAFSKEALAEGINLADKKTPMVEQARKVHELTIKHNDIHFWRWRQVEVPLQKEPAAELAKVLAAMDEFEAGYVKKQREAARPTSHFYMLTPKK